MKKQNKTDLQLAQFPAWKNFQVTAQEGGTDVGLGRLPELWRWSWESGKTKADRIWRTEYQKRESWTERTPEICPPHCSAKYSSVHECEETTQGWRKNHPWALEEQFQMLTHGWGQYLLPKDSRKKIIIHGTLGTVLQKVLPQPQKWGIISLSLNNM